MDIIETPTPQRSVSTRALQAPLALTVVAWLIGGGVALAIGGRDGCTDYSGKPTLAAWIVVALVIQGVAFFGSLAAASVPHPHRWRELVLVLLASLLALPAAAMLYLAIHPLFCGSFLF